LEGFRHTFPIDVRFRDIDALGHVNNAVYLTYTESARIEYFRHVAFNTPQQPLDEMSLILAEITCTFKRPVVYGQRVVVGTRVVRMGNSSYQLESQIDADGETATLVKAVVVHYDYAAGRSAPIPPEVRARINDFEGLAE
jgi:acyl-CoA thioester hydrolase